jgi:benzoate-CoA ligase family protein
LDHNLDAGRADKVALHCQGQSWTYSQLSEGAARCAAALRRREVQREERVLLILPDGVDFVLAWFGVLRAGAVFCMVNPRLLSNDFSHYLKYTKARIVICDRKVLPELEDAMRGMENPPRLLVSGGKPGKHESFDAALAAEDPQSDLAHTAPTNSSDLAGWLFTSGSTGQPKGCVHTQGDFVFSTEAYGLGLVGYEESDICLSVPKLFFGYATGTNLMFPFRVGATVVLFPGRATPEEILKQIAKHKPTFLTSVPTLINGMLDAPELVAADLGCLRRCISAGEALPQTVYERWLDLTGVEILDGIGSAEMFHIYISNAPGDVTLGSLGRLVPGYEAEIVGPDGAPVPEGEPGLLRIRGGSTALCYWADRQSSSETFQGDWCTTADIFRRDAEDRFWYEGRADDLLKVSGIWCSPLEIEEVLRGHDSVQDVCIVPGKDAAGLTKPLAFVVPSSGVEGGDALAADLKSYIKARLAPHKYPRWFEWRTELPRNDRDKVARRILEGEATKLEL